MRKNRQSLENDSQMMQPDPELTSAVRLAVEQTLLAMGIDPKHPVKPSKEGDPQVKTIDLIGLMFYVLEKFWIVLIAALFFAGVMGFIARNSVPMYTATSKLYIVNPASSGISIADLQLGSVLTLDYQEVFKTWEVHEMVREELNLPYSYEAMQSFLNVSNPEDTRLLYISVTYPDAQLAADIANAYAKAAKEFIISTMKGEEPSDFSIALVPGVAQAVSKSRSVVMGFMLGSVLAVGVLTLLFVLDNSPRTPDDIGMNAGVSTLAVLPAAKEMKEFASQKNENEKPDESARGKMRLSRFPELDYVTAEGFNTLVTNISYCGGDTRRIMVTSRYASEGKSYVTMNLMRTLAGMGRRVVVVDTDLRASGIQANYSLRYGRRNHFGLSEYLVGYCGIEESLYETTIPNAWIIPAGHRAPNPLQLLDSQKMENLMDWLESQFDIVLIDTPPVGILVDAVALAKYCDGAVIVVGYRQGKISEVTTAVDSIKQTGCRILGAVLNEVRFKSMSNRHYYYNSKRYSGYYQRYYGNEKNKRDSRQ